MEYNVYITNNAKMMINRHIRFLNNVNVKASIRLKQTFKEYIIILKHFPRIGRKINQTNKKLPFTIRKMVINKRYILIYAIYKNNIFIEAILDVRQNKNYY